MVTEAAHVRIVEQFIPSGGGIRVLRTYLATRKPRRHRYQMHTAHAENADADECATRQCNQRYQWSHRYGNLAHNVAGERDPNKLASRKNSLIRATQAQIAQSLEGDWREELLFVLEQSLELYDTYLGKITKCDERIEAHLKTMESKLVTDPQPASALPQSRKHGPRFDLRNHLYRVAGVDLTKVDGLQVQTVQTIISEIGVDMSRWNTEKNFASWLGLCPDNRVSGGKVLKRGTRQVVNRAATAFRLAAWSLIRSQSALGANFRRLRSKLGAPKAVTAMAHKLARLVYRMLKFGADYIDKGMEAYESRYRQQQTKWLTKKAAALNLQLIPAPTITG